MVGFGTHISSAGLTACFLGLAWLAPAPSSAQNAPTNDVSFGPGPIDPGFEGWAYPVPAHPDPADPNAVPVTLYGRNGDIVGTDVVRAGQAQWVEAFEGDADEVAVRRADGLTAVGAREDFWAMPSFIELEHVTVTLNGSTRSLGESGLRYHRGDPGQLDAPSTPQYEGIVTRTRGFLACRADTWSMGQQTMTADVIELGVYRNDRSLVEKGVTGLDWGVAVPINDAGVHELSRECDGTTVADYGYTHHTTQWLESMGRAVYLLAASDYAGEYHSKIGEYIDHIELIASRLVDPENWDYWERHIDDGTGNDFTHRTFMMAAALGLASTLTDDADDAERWAERAATIVQRGIDNQWPNGVNPERGGYDVQYQIYGTWLAQLYSSTLAAQQALKADVDHTIDRAVAWMAGRVDDQTGQIDIRGSTRICAETNWWSGTTAESFDASEVVRAFLLWGHLQSDRGLVDLATLVARGQKELGNPCPAGEHPLSSTTSQDDGSGAVDRAADDAQPGNTGDDRSFDTPLGNLSLRRVLAAAGAGLLCLAVLSRVRLAGSSTASRVFCSAGGAAVVFVATLVVLAG